MHIPVIYRAINIHNGRFYIGSTNNLERRKREHKSHRFKDGGAFHAAIIEDGFDAFEWEVLENVTMPIAINSNVTISSIFEILSEKSGFITFAMEEKAAKRMIFMVRIIHVMENIKHQNRKNTLALF